ELERLDEGSADARVVAAHVEHPEAAEHVEIAAALVIPQVGTLCPRPCAIEADRLQHPGELRVDRLRPQLEALASAGLDQIAKHHLTVTQASPLRLPLANRKVDDGEQVSATPPTKERRWRS